jgi:hypothetical protein
MLTFNPNDSGDTPYKIRRVVKESDLTLQQICERLESEFDVKVTTSALSRSISRGTLRMQRAMEILNGSQYESRTFMGIIDSYFSIFSWCRNIP